MLRRISLIAASAAMLATSGALGLYEGAGFTVDHTSVTQAKPLLP
jgi:hypothetical protein